MLIHRWKLAIDRSLEAAGQQKLGLGLCVQKNGLELWPYEFFTLRKMAQPVSA